MPLTLIRGNLLEMHTDAIVNAANPALAEGGGVCGAIFQAAGAQQMRDACAAIGECPTGQAVLTPGFRLAAKYVIHTPGPVWAGGRRGEAEMLAACYQNALALAQEHHLTSIAFPLISAGIYGYPPEQAMHVAVRAIGDYLLTHDDIDVYLVRYLEEPAQRQAPLLRDIEAYLTQRLEPQTDHPQPQAVDADSDSLPDFLKPVDGSEIAHIHLEDLKEPEPLLPLTNQELFDIIAQLDREREDAKALQWSSRRRRRIDFADAEDDPEDEIGYQATPSQARAYVPYPEVFEPADASPVAAHPTGPKHPKRKRKKSRPSFFVSLLQLLFRRHLTAGDFLETYDDEDDEDDEDEFSGSDVKPTFFDPFAFREARHHDDHHALHKRLFPFKDDQALEEELPQTDADFDDEPEAPPLKWHGFQEEESPQPEPQVQSAAPAPTEGKAPSHQAMPTDWRTDDGEPLPDKGYPAHAPYPQQRIPPTAPRSRSEPLAEAVTNTQQATTEAIRRALLERSLEGVFGAMQDTFSEAVIRRIDKMQLKDPTVYKRANLDRKLFCKLRNDRAYSPSRRTALSLCIALELTLDETGDLLGRAGFALSAAKESDLIIAYFIEHGRYDIFELNEVLFTFNQPCLGV